MQKVCGPSRTGWGGRSGRRFAGRFLPNPPRNRLDVRIVSFYGMAAKLVEVGVFEELLEALSHAWLDEEVEFWFAKDLADRIRKDFPSMVARFLPPAGNRVFEEALPEGTSLLVCLGGDGTLLDTLHLVKDSGIAVLGIHFGRLGFLNAVSAGNIEKTLYPGFFDDFRRENRLVLEACDFEVDAGFSGTLPEKFPYALNEVALLKADTESLVFLDVYVDGSYVNTYYGDGVIFSTPTGSTAYSLSCGGPILIPSADNILITPVASHTLTVRPLVLEGYQEITVKARGKEQCKVSLDSHAYELKGPFSFKVRKSSFKFITIYPNDRNFFDAIREKLMWGLDIRQRPE